VEVKEKGGKVKKRGKGEKRGGKEGKNGKMEKKEGGGVGVEKRDEEKNPERWANLTKLCGAEPGIDDTRIRVTFTRIAVTPSLRRSTKRICRNMMVTRGISVQRPYDNRQEEGPAAKIQV